MQRRGLLAARVAAAQSLQSAPTRRVPALLLSRGFFASSSNKKAGKSSLARAAEHARRQAGDQGVAETRGEEHRYAPAARSAVESAGHHTRYPPLAHRYKGALIGEQETRQDAQFRDVEEEHDRLPSASLEDPPFEKLLIANRGEIACRVIRTCAALGIRSVAVHSEADAHSKHVQEADESVCLGPAASSESYLQMERIIEACKLTGATAVHPGYGFLSENTEFSQMCADNNIAFVGPGAFAISAMGDKIESKKLAEKAGVNVIPGRLAEIEVVEDVLEIARELEYPIMIKASAGGGGKGMRVAWNDEEARDGFRLAKQEAMASFGDDRILIEKFIDEPRHVEVQVLADGKGNCIYLNERECSVQRRNQKVLEEAPSPFMTPAKRREMGEQACALAKAVDYASAGTVEFLMDSKRNFYFLEMNTRLQVEHPVTEKITGVDLVEQMIRIAAGKELTIKQEDVGIDGWAMEARVYAEDPARNFLPSIGELTRYKEPLVDDPTVRCDAGVRAGDEISMFYDPLICKLIAWGPNRQASINKLADALDRYEIRGVNHNIPFLRACMDNPRYRSGKITTNFIAEEFPDGFQGVQLSGPDLKDLVSMSAVQHWMRELRERMMGHIIEDVKTDVRELHSREEGASFVVRVNRSFVADGEPTYDEVNTSIIPISSMQLQDLMLQRLSGEVEPTPQQQQLLESLSGENLGETFYAVHTEWENGDVQEMVVDFDDWVVGETLLESACIEGGDVRRRVMQVDRVNLDGRYSMTFNGTAFGVQVMSPEHAELVHLLPEPQMEDSSKIIRSPMPGHLLTLNVAEGDNVVIGQEICVIEAMKLQNSVRAEQDGVVKSILVAAGEDVDVDEIIVEFE